MPDVARLLIPMLICLIAPCLALLVGLTLLINLCISEIGASRIRDKRRRKEAEDARRDF